jgi:putative transposase
MDFMADALLDGGRIRILTAIDLHTRECVALEVDRSFTGADVTRVLEATRQARGLPKRIRVDNGTEFTSRAMDYWAYVRGVSLDFSRPGKPVDNAFIEAFNANLRRECLSQHWFHSIEDAQRTLDRWREEYNNERPHSSLGDLAPTPYRVGARLASGQTELAESHSRWT